MRSGCRRIKSKIHLIFMTSQMWSIKHKTSFFLSDRIKWKNSDDILSLNILSQRIGFKMFLRKKVRDKKHYIFIDILALRAQIIWAFLLLQVFGSIWYILNLNFCFTKKIKKISLIAQWTLRIPAKKKFWYSCIFILFISAKKLGI